MQFFIKVTIIKLIIFNKYATNLKTTISHRSLRISCRFQIGCAFVKYDMFNTTKFIQNCLYMNFRLNSTYFYINFSRHKLQIDVLSFNAWGYQVSSYTPSYIPFHFSFTVPWNIKKMLKGTVKKKWKGG